MVFEYVFFVNCKCLQKSILNFIYQRLPQTQTPFGGGEHPAVEDFLRASLRELRKVEKAAEQAWDDGVD